MALSNAIVFEVQTGGSDNNSGGYKTGATGTDFSQQTATQFALTGLTSVGAGAIILTATAAATMVGNCINITGGTNFTTGIYEIISVSVGASITVDRNVTTGAGVAGTANIGGCFLTPKKSIELMTVTGQITYIKSGTYSFGTGISTQAGVVPSNGICRVIGYTTTRSDGGPTRPILRASGGITILTDANGGFRFENLDIDGNSVASTTGVTLSNNNLSTLFNCIVRRNTGWGVTQTTGSSNAIQCQITGNAFGGWQQNGTGGALRHCYIYSNTGAGCEIIGSRFVISDCVFYSNTGASSDGVIVNTAYSTGMNTIIRNTFMSSGRDGIRLAGTYVHGEISYNILISNAGYGINSAQTPIMDDVSIHHNGYYNNTTAARNNLNAGTGDVTLTADPFVASGSNDFRLSNTANANLARNKSLVLLQGTDYSDFGPLQAIQNLLINPQR